MINANGYAAPSAGGKFQPHSFERRDVGANDVLVDILFCGICHSDIHTVRDEWGPQKYPLIPGHEMAGRVRQVGKKVRRFKVGDTVGVGCFVMSCRKCDACKAGNEQHCAKVVFSYGAPDAKTGGVTQGGYSNCIVVDENYVLRIPGQQPLERVASLLCAGITTYSPLKAAGVRKGMKVGIVGLGGLGHMGVKIAKAMGAEVTVFSTSAGKKPDAKRLGAKNFVISKNPAEMAAWKGKLDFILNTVAARHDLIPFIDCLKLGRKMVLVGAPDKPHDLPVFPLIFGRKSLGGSLIGGIKETQEMLNFCAKKKVLSDVEVIAPSQIDAAYERTVAGDVKYRFVIDLAK